MPKQKKRADQDSPWKKILRQYFPQAISFFFPAVAETIDWEKPYEFLDKEFQKIAPDAEQGKRYADKLVRVWLKGGHTTYLLLHVEIQAQKEEEFARRMLTYSIRKQRKEWKFGLMRRLYERGWSRQDIFYLYEFLDWVMILPEGLETQFWQELKQFEEARKMKYVTNAERIGMQKGQEMAKLEIAQELLRKGMAIADVASVTKLPIDQVQQLQNSLSESSKH